MQKGQGRAGLLTWAYRYSCRHGLTPFFPFVCKPINTNQNYVWPHPLSITLGLFSWFNLITPPVDAFLTVLSSFPVSFSSSLSRFLLSSTSRLLFHNFLLYHPSLLSSLPSPESFTPPARLSLLHHFWFFRCSSPFPLISYSTILLAPSP
jgi:hypothetical protein